MKTIVIKTQAELNALPDSFSDSTVIRIEGGTITAPIVISKAWESSHVVAWGSSHVVARESSHVEAWESSHVEAWESSHVEAWESSHVVAWGSSHVVARGSSHVVARESSHVVARESSHVVARESSHVVARESSHVVAWESSHVVAWGSSHVEAWGSSHVVAWGSSHVVAWESSHVEAWGSSHVVAWGSSHVVARESSHVVARESVAIHNQSIGTTLEIGGFVVAFLISKAKSIKRLTKTAQTVTPKRKAGVSGWLDDEAIKATRGKVTLYKRVSSGWKTQEGTLNETAWTPGSVVESPKPKWSPEGKECGDGKFHACSRPYFCDEFRSTRGDRYVAIEVAVADMHAWRDAAYPHKVAFRAGRVIFECDKFGKEVKP